MLTPRENNALRYIKIVLQDTGAMPPYGKIAAALGLRSRSSAHAVTRRLVDAGYLAIGVDPSRPARVLVDPDAEGAACSTVRVAGGAFTPRPQTITRLAADLACPRFGIEHDDTLVLEIGGRAAAGTLSVVALPGRQLRVCRLLESPQGLHLEGADDAGPCLYDPRAHAITSRIVGFFRTFEDRR